MNDLTKDLGVLVLAMDELTLESTRLLTETLLDQLKWHGK
jgi:hypothetical protein